MQPVLRFIARPNARAPIHNVLSRQWTAPHVAADGASAQAKFETRASPDSAALATFACVGIDTDMNGAVVLITCQRNDSVVQSKPGEGEPVVRSFYAPTGAQRDELVQQSQKEGRFAIVVERPSPMPDVDGWQSAAVCAYNFGVLMGVLASNSMISWDQQAELAASSASSASQRRRGRPRRSPTPDVIEVLAQQWKRQMQLQGTGKDASRELAASILPSFATQLKRKKDHGRAEAALLAVWGTMLARSHLDARMEAAAAAAGDVDGNPVPAFNEDEQSQRLRKLVGASVPHAMVHSGIGDNQGRRRIERTVASIQAPRRQAFRPT